MLDASVVDLMHHLDQTPPAHVRAADVAGLASPQHAAKAQESLEAVEEDVAAWLVGAEERFRLVAEALAAGELDGEDILKLKELAERIDESVRTESKEFSKDQKLLRRIIKRIRASSAADGKLVAAFVRRYLQALAKRGLATAEYGYAVRSMIAEAERRNDASPVFDNPGDLGKYLRAAIA